MSERRPRQVRSDGAAAPLVPRDGWSDGIHYVRPATVKDRHPMRWVVGAHKSGSSTFKLRHTPSFEAGLAVAQMATERHIAANPADVAAQASEPENHALRVSLPPFATTYFHCIYANPIAQVWQCVGIVGSKGSVGRRTKEGRPAQQTEVPHPKGSCAVLKGDEPVRNEDGSVRVFSWAEADEYALWLYETADEEERILWPRGHKKVGGTRRVDVIFDPDVNGHDRPFSLYLPEFCRPVYEDRTVMAEPGNGITFFGSKEEIKQQRRQWAILNRVPSFEERPIRFRSITGAQQEAERRERMMGGIV